MLIRMLALGCNWLIEPIHLDAWQPCFVDFCWGGSPTFKLHIGAPAHVHGRLRRPPGSSLSTSSSPPRPGTPWRRILKTLSRPRLGQPDSAITHGP